MSAATLKRAREAGQLDMFGFAVPVALEQAAPAQVDESAATDPAKPFNVGAAFQRGKEVVPVDPKRLDREGDIVGSYSADTLAYKGSIRRTFRLNGFDWVTTANCYGPDYVSSECYRVVAPEVFSGPKESSLGDPRGGYHGRRAKHGSKPVVLQGPPIVCIKGKPDQDALL